MPEVPVKNKRKSIFAFHNGGNKFVFYPSFTGITFVAPEK
ncbi:MAG: hypothetical protein H6Q23_315 [Bacteroidetes bacterium]|nr:hypothetical protein [Bacteroidota bacterium]